MKSEQHVLDTGFLNGLRALAALLVLICHCLIWSYWPEGRVPRLPGPGHVAKLAVDLFMILSGFLMVYNSVQRAADEPMSSPESWYKFYIRRFFRIAPAYYVSLFSAVVLSGPFLSGFGELADRIPGWPADFPYNGKKIEYTATNIAMHVSFLFGLFPKWGFSTQLPDWSLSLEMQFYAVFPLLFVLVQRFGVLRVCAVAVVPCIYAITYWRSYYLETAMLLFKLPVFLTGMLLCYAAFAPTLWRRIVLTAVALALPLTQFPYYFGRDALLIAAAAGGIAFLTIRLESQNFLFSIQRFFRALLDNKLTKFGSDISFSVYLFHGFFIAIAGSALFRYEAILTLNRDLRSFIFVLAVLPGTIIVATLVYRFVELPGINLGRRIVSSIGTRKLRSAEINSR